MNAALKFLVVLALVPLVSVAAVADQPARSKTRIQIEYLNVPNGKVEAFTHVAVVRLASFPEAGEPLTVRSTKGEPVLVMSELWKLENVIIAAR